MKQPDHIHVYFANSELEAMQEMAEQAGASDGDTELFAELECLRASLAVVDSITEDMHQWHDTGAHIAPFEFCNQPVCKFARQLIEAREART